MTRRDRIARARRRLLEETSPRLHMALIVAMTAIIGWVASFVLLRLGLDSMAIRYPLATGVAYIGFLGLIWLWLRSNASDYTDVVDLSSDLLMQVPDAGHSGGLFSQSVSGGGGQFAGGGASGGWDSAIADDTTALDGVDGDSLGEALGSVSDADEMTIPLVVVFLLIGLAFASFYVIYVAPLLLAEVMVDGAIAYAFFRHMRGLDPHHWLSSAMRRSVVPFALTAAFLSVTGLAMAHYAPDAHSIGGVVKHTSSP